ncbi:hypothetical protein EVAR_101448_1 [Eumeta japonica]|uniref:Uncharacterized protein n=1 Tax=Eumeta variegata TaxID=151549 RepID=A0A4C1SK22_EUMVA|nr:hypothetical protein EVAR_101448_1 [Eumeta japonica]
MVFMVCAQLCHYTSAGSSYYFRLGKASHLFGNIRRLWKLALPGRHNVTILADGYTLREEIEINAVPAFYAS